MARTKSARRRTAPSAQSVLQAAAEVVMTSNAILENHHANASTSGSVDTASENICEETLLNDPDGDGVGEIDIDPNDTSLLEETASEPTTDAADVDMGGDDGDKSMAAASDGDSAVGSDVRVDSSFQSSSSSAANTTADAPVDDGVTDSVGDSDVVDDGSAVTAVSGASSEPETIHECVSVISDAVHAQKTLTCGIVDTQMVRFPFFVVADRHLITSFRFVIVFMMLKGF